MQSWTAPYDPRFPNRNQARHCFVRFNEYHKCVFERSEDHARCEFYQKAYQSLCPNDWVGWGSGVDPTCFLSSSLVFFAAGELERAAREGPVDWQILIEACRPCKNLQSVTN